MPKKSTKKIKAEPGAKGAKIVITGGDRKGQTGWYDDSRAPTQIFFYVCIKLANGEDEWGRRVSKKYVKPLVPPSPASNLVEAVMQQHDDVELAIEETAMKMVECKLGFTQLLLHQSGEVFKRKLKEAHIQYISQLGNRAMFRDTHFAGDEKDISYE